MAEVDQLLTAATVTLDTVDPDHPDAQHCLRSYFTELQARFDAGCDPARSLVPDAGELRPPRGLLLLARLHAEPIGCAGLKLPPGAPAEIKRMWVAPPSQQLCPTFRPELTARDRPGIVGGALPPGAPVKVRCDRAVVGVRLGSLR